MNKIFLACLLSGSLPFFSFDVFADDLVQFPKGDASWTVDVAPSGTSAKAQASRQVQHVEVTQLNNIKRIRITWTDGKSTEKWAIPGLPVIFEEDPRDGSVIPLQSGGPRNVDESFFLTYDFFAFAWLKPECLKEKDPIDYQGKQCFHYVGGVVAPGDRFANPRLYKREAWIDVKTLLPVAFENETSLSIFTFSPKPPTGPVEFPPRFKQAVDSYKAAMGYQ